MNIFIKKLCSCWACIKIWRNMMFMVYGTTRHYLNLMRVVLKKDTYVKCYMLGWLYLKVQITMIVHDFHDQNFVLLFYFFHLNRKRIVSSVKPTRLIHVENYLGAMKNWIHLQVGFLSFFLYFMGERISVKKF